MGFALPVPTARPTPGDIAFWLLDTAKQHGERGAVLGADGHSVDQARSLALQSMAVLFNGPERDLFEHMDRALRIEARGYGYNESDGLNLEDRTACIRSACDELCRRLERAAESMPA